MSEPGHNIRLRSSARTNVGQVRQNNEDNVRLWAGEHAALAVVADGMGGAAAGEEASRLAVEAIQSGMALHEEEDPRKLQNIGDDKITRKIRESILNANLSIIQRAAETPEMRGMGTTLTLAFVYDTQVIVAHVGDSRAYHISAVNGQIRQITSDHSFVEALFAAGHITREQADEHPMRNVLYRALGQTEDIDVDVYHSALQVGDRLVLCSDGLTRHVKPEEIAQAALMEDMPDSASQKLIDLANERGGEDNVSVIVIFVEQAGEQHTLSAQRVLSPQSEEPNEDDTLVFGERERPQALKDAANARKTPLNAFEQDRLVGSVTAPDRPAPSTAPPRRWDAERLNDPSGIDDLPDARGSETLPERSSLDKATPKRPDTLDYLTSARRFSPSLKPVPLARGSQESDGEGRDVFK